MTVAPLPWQDALRQDVAPVLAGYILVLGCLIAYRRTRRNASGKQVNRCSSGRPASLRYLASTFLGGFSFFLGIVAVFYFVISGQSRSIVAAALWQGSVLAFGMVLPAFLVWSRIEERRRRSRQGMDPPT